MEKIFISGCFMGENVRYDGGHQALSHQMIKKWQAEKRLVSACPECLGGLTVPRAPAEIQSNNQKVITIYGVDVTKNFTKGAEAALNICIQHKIKFALLKESSPSCGSNTIYNGAFSNTKIAGQGVTAKLLTEHNIQVFSENTIESLIMHINAVDQH